MPIIDIKLSPEAIEEFRLIWKEEFGEEISHEDAEIRGKELIRLFVRLHSYFFAGLK